MKEKIKTLLGVTDERFSLRKLNVGVCSVILGLAFVGGTTENVYADTSTAATKFTQSKSTEIVSPECDQAQKDSIDHEEQETYQKSSNETNKIVSTKINEQDNAESIINKKSTSQSPESSYTSNNEIQPANNKSVTVKAENKHETTFNLLAKKLTYNKLKVNSDLYKLAAYSVSDTENSWHNDGSGWTYSKADGERANEEWILTPDNKWYYFDDNGDMAHDGWVDTYNKDNGTWSKYYFDHNGHFAVSSWHNDGSGWTYSKADGKQANEEWILTPDNKWYYFDDNGDMAHDGWVDTYNKDNGTWSKYYFDHNGHCSI